VIRQALRRQPFWDLGWYALPASLGPWLLKSDQFRPACRCPSLLSSTEPSKNVKLPERRGWPDGFRCPRCEGRSTGYHWQATSANQCRRLSFIKPALTAEVPSWRQTKLPLTTWFLAFYSSASQDSDSSLALRRHFLGVNYERQWLLQNRSAAMKERVAPMSQRKGAGG